MKGLQALKVDERTVLAQPIEGFIKKARVMAPDLSGGQQQCLRVDDARGFGWLGMPGRPEAAPLPPQEI